MVMPAATAWPDKVRAALTSMVDESMKRVFFAALAYRK
jgi:hypothetical protein